MKRFKRLLNSAGFKFIAKTCFVGIVIMVWNYLLNLQFSKNFEKSYSKLGQDINVPMRLVRANKISEKKFNKQLNMSSFSIIPKDGVSGINVPIKSNISALIILSSMRSGSSFFGQFFNQNPSIFYFFEPLFLFADA